jgi:WD40 repeat protein
VTADDNTSHTVDAENPWPGLASFREADRELFYGRERETEELFRLVMRERLTILFGLSGLGKTSLLQAGLFPRLRDENALPVLIRFEHSDSSPSCTEQMQTALARAAAAAGAEIPAFRDGETVWEYLHRQGNEFWSARNRPLIPVFVFDQFEEIFTLGAGRPGTAGLLETLTSLSEGHPPAAVKARLDENPAEAREFSFGRHSYKLLLSLREDFLPELEALRDRIRGIGNNRMRVRRMDGENALRVVSLPGRGLIDAGVAEQVVRFVAGKDAAGQELPLAAMEVEPALLSIVCRELNNQRKARGEAKITAALLEGSRAEILSDLYERSLADLGPEVRNFIEERLITVSGFRDNVALDNVLAMPGITRAEIDLLTERRLLRIEDRGNGQRLELTHDVLAGVVRNSRDTRRQREAQAKAEAVRRELEERERKMRRELRRSRRALAVFAVLLVGVIALSLRVYSLRNKAKQALAAANLESAFNLEEGRSQQALAFLAQALHEDASNLGARALLFDLLLKHSWLLPVRETAYPETAYIEIAGDGQSYAVLRLAGDIVLQDVAGGRRIGEPLRHPSPILDLQFCSDGQRLITSSSTETRLWDARTGRQIGQPFADLNNSVRCLDPHCDLVWQDTGSTVRFLDAATGALAGPPLPLESVVSRFSPDRVRIVTAEREGDAWVARLRNLRTGEAIGAPMPHTEVVRRAELSPDGHLIAVFTGTGVQMWDGDTQARLPLLSLAAPVDDAVFSPDGKLLVTHSLDDVTQVWEGRSGRSVLRLPLDADWWTAEVSPDGKTLILITEDRTLRLWDLETGRLLYEPVADVSSARLLSGPGHRLVTASEDGVARLLTSMSAAQSVLVGTPTSLFDAAAFSSDARRVATTEGGTLSVRDTVTGETVGSPLAGVGPAVRLRFVDDDRKVAAILKDRALTWDFAAGRIAAQIALQPWWPAFDDISPDGTKAVVVTSPVSPPVLRVVDLATGKPLTPPLEHKAISRVPPPFSPDSRSLLIAPTESSLQAVDTATGKVRLTLNPQAGRILSALFSPDGQRILTASDDRTARLWDAGSGRLMRSFVGPHSLASAAFAAGGHSILTIAEDTRVRQWSIENGKLEGRPLLTPTARTVQHAPRDERILVLSEDTARLWDSTTGRPLGNPISPGGRIFDARFSPRGNRLFIISEESLSTSDIPLGDARDADLLARWATAVSGYSLDDRGLMNPLPDAVARLEALRKETADAPLGEATPRSLIRWFLMDPAQRAASPLAER